MGVKRGILISLSIVQALWDQFVKLAKERKVPISLLYTEAAHYAIEQKIPLVYHSRRLYKPHLKEELEKEFPMHPTSLYLDPSLLDELEKTYGKSSDLKLISHTILYVYVRLHNPSFNCLYFDDEYFQRKYQFTEVDYLVTFKRIYKKLGHIPTVRDIKAHREKHEPSEYHFIKTYGSFKAAKDYFSSKVGKSD